MSLIVKADTISLSFIMSMASLSYNDTIQLSLPRLEPRLRYCQLLEEPFEVIHNDLPAFFLCQRLC
jgi:hypothetical protein